MILVSAADAQHAFIYLQTENNMVYTARWNGSVFPSSSGGYVMIPEVSSGDQTITLSFPQQLYADYSFVIPVDQSRGFSLRLNTDNSWSLFDMIDFVLVKGKPIAKPLKPVFIADDPAVRIKTQNQPAAEIAKPEAPKTIPSQLIKPAAIQKIFDKSGTTGIDQVYIIIHEKRTDTIALFIPVIENEQKPEGTQPSAFNRPSNAKVLSEIAFELYTPRKKLLKN